MSEHMRGTSPLLVGVAPKQHPEVLQTAAGLAAKLGTRLLCAYVDEASYLVEWDPARSAHRLSLHPDDDAENIGGVTMELKAAVPNGLFKPSRAILPVPSPNSPPKPTRR